MGTHPGSIWRYNKECCHLGDVAVGGYTKSAVYIAKEVNPALNILALPVSFSLVYWNKKSEAGNVAIWKATCPDYYVALGTFATPNFNQPNPAAVNFRCVNEVIVDDNAKWTWVYNDVNSDVPMHTTFFRSDPTIKTNVGIWAMTGVRNWPSSINDQALALKAANVSLRFSKPIKSVVMQNMVYDFTNQQVVSQTQSDITNGARLIINNCGINCT